MATRLKPVKEQTIVITGATSGIGLCTARKAAQQGAKVILVARSEQDLRELEREVIDSGGQAAFCAADVADLQDVRKIAQTAISRFGGFDTWVNDAGLSIWGKLEQVSPEDHRRLFDTNFWGVVNGSLVALEHLKQRGGAIINLGSVASDQALPLQGMYCASKHAVKGFTDALRIELEEEKAPISVTLIKPAAIDTPFAEHAKNYMEQEAKLPPPLYRPQEVAMAILYAAAHPTRDIYVGSASKLMSTSNKLAPRLNDLYMEKVMIHAEQGDAPAGDREGTLYHPGRGMAERGNNGWARPSLYTRSALHPWITGAVLGAAGAAIAGAVTVTRQRHKPLAKRIRDTVGL